MELRVTDINKSFGDNHVLRGINFSAKGGYALGLLGRNGAGKTTTIRIIMNVFPADSGTVRLDDKALTLGTGQIGYLPEERGLYPKLRVAHQLVYFARLRGLSSGEAKVAAEKWMERLQISHYAGNKLDTLSKGNQQKIQLALALITDPQIVILDEPFSGLDPVNAKILKDVIREQVEQGKIVLFSSHQMAYVETFCDDVALMHEGQIVLSGNINTIKHSYPRNRIHIRLSNPESDNLTPSAETQKILEEISSRGGIGVEQYLPGKDGGYTVLLQDPEDRQKLLFHLVNSRHDVEDFSIALPSLEEIFIEKTGVSQAELAEDQAAYEQARAEAATRGKGKGRWGKRRNKR